MKPIAHVLLLCASPAVVGATEADAGRPPVSLAHRGSAVGGGAVEVAAREAAAAKVDSEMEELVVRLLRPHEKRAPSTEEVVAKGMRNVDVEVAASRLQGVVPQDIYSLVHAGVGAKADALRRESQPFKEESLQKARKALNTLIQKSNEELDTKLIACKEFEDKNRGTFQQVMADLSRLGEGIANTEKAKAQAGEMINQKEAEMNTVQAALKAATGAFLKKKLENTAEMAIRKADLAVFEFMLRIVRCKDKAAAFEQLGQQPEEAEVSSRICESDGGFDINFDDQRANAKIESMMNPEARAAVREVLNDVVQTQMQQAAGMIQWEAAQERAADKTDMDLNEALADSSNSSEVLEREAAFSELGIPDVEASPGQDELGRDEDLHLPDIATSAEGLMGAASAALSLFGKPKKGKPVPTTTGSPPPPAIKAKVAKGPDPRAAALKCTKGPPDCGLLHDKMSLMWGKFKDLVDELQAQMDKNAVDFETLKDNFNSQMDGIRGAKGKFVIALSEAIASLSGLREEAGKKEEQRLELEKEYKKGMKMCRKQIEYIVFQDICSYTTVRSTIMKFSKLSPPDKIVDCGQSSWTPSECSVPCDNKCPDKTDPNKCGGIQTLTRTIVTAPNKFGFKCGLPTRTRKCNQKKCPQDCKHTKWSSWSKCTKECEGGVQGRSRNIVVQPKNGGTPCGSVSESRPCNTGSCDRNCKLSKWSRWTPCSVACDGGFQEQRRKVLVPIRGKGICPKPKSKFRYKIKKCNVHKCTGDEICIAQQDLVIAIDGSGSITEKGFGILKTFVGKLVNKYRGKYHATKAMQVGVVQFGNGRILDDGSIRDAIPVLDLTSDMKKVKKAVKGIKFTKGFTNMAQAFGVAEKILGLGGRKMAQSAVLTITDGKPSFVFQTYEKVRALRDKKVKLFFAPVTEFKGKEIALMKKWASIPWPTHLERIPGLAAMKADEKVFVQKVLVKFCSNTISPTATKAALTFEGYMLVASRRQCGKRKEKLAEKVPGPVECAKLAVAKGYTAFSLGKAYAAGKCYAEGLKVTEEIYEGFVEAPASPPCPAGKWKKDALYDFYAVVPAQAGMPADGTETGAAADGEDPDEEPETPEDAKLTDLLAA